MIRPRIEALIKARIEAGLTQRAMNRKLGKSSGYMSLVENGRSNVSPESAKQICELLGRRFDELFYIDYSSQATRTA